MLRLVLSLLAPTALSALAGCSDLGSASCTGSECGTDGGGYDDPGPQTLTIRVGCRTDADPNIQIMDWDLTVDPNPIVADGAFGATFSGVYRMDELVLDDVQRTVGGYKRTNVLGLKATVHVRDGVTSEERDVVLTIPPGGETCAFDKNGNAGRTAGPTFPICSPDNDDPEDGSNRDCTGLGNAPDPRNPCGQFIPLPTSEDPNACAELKKAAQYELYDFCITGDLLIPLTGPPTKSFIAAAAGDVLFGWDDQGWDTTQPDGPVWTLSSPNFDDEIGPNGFRVRVRYDNLANGTPVAYECTMASGTPGALRPTRGDDLISFEIQTP